MLLLGCLLAHLKFIYDGTGPNSMGKDFRHNHFVTFQDIIVVLIRQLATSGASFNRGGQFSINLQ